jgi:hypothetical protein
VFRLRPLRGLGLMGYSIADPEAAPDDPAVALANLQQWATYCALFWIDGKPGPVVGAGCLADFRLMIRAVLAMLLLRRDGAPFVQLQCIDKTGASEAWIDPTTDDQGKWAADWNGMLNAELRFGLGLGDKV